MMYSLSARGSKRNSTGVLPLPMAPLTRSATPRSAPARRSRFMKGSALVYSDRRWSCGPTPRIGLAPFLGPLRLASPLGLRAHRATSRSRDLESKNIQGNDG